MKTQTLLLPAADPTALQQAFDLIRAGEPVAFPTDTVYGIGVLAFEASAIEKLFTIKEREISKAIPILVGSPEALELVTVEINEIALRLAQRFWPGPLTLIAPRHPALPPNIAPSHPTIGVRMPDHPIALALLRMTGPLAVTSANISGGANTCTAQEVLDQLEGRLPLILDGGPTPGGLPSTVVDCTGSHPLILRSGPISMQDMQSAL